MEKNMKKNYKRYLKLNLPIGQSTFLWGARKTGKSHYLKTYFADSVFYDLLKTDEYFRLLKKPHLLREEVLALGDEELKRPIIIDEIQKIPALLNEVHYLIENSDAYFILCGSSARKLKKEGINLLGGRAWRYEFYPLVYPEIDDFDLLKALNYGLIPSHYQATHWKKTATAYINDYLKEEIQAEGLTRNLKAFSEFLDIAAFSNGETLNFNNIARDCGIDSKTVKEYYQILVDTLLGYHLHPYRERAKREQIVATPKFYFFDVGVTNRLMKNEIFLLKGQNAGKLFEHFIFMELMAYRGLNGFEFDISFWRTNSGLEVDFILGKGEIAIEVKIDDRFRKSEIKGLLTFAKEYKPKRAIVVSMIPNKRKLTLEDGGTLELIPWKDFLEMLWNGQIIKA